MAASTPSFPIDRRRRGGFGQRQPIHVNNCPISLHVSAMCQIVLHYDVAAVPTGFQRPELTGLLVAPTGVDPVTFRFSVERSTN